MSLCNNPMRRNNIPISQMRELKCSVFQLTNITRLASGGVGIKTQVCLTASVCLTTLKHYHLQQGRSNALCPIGRRQSGCHENRHPTLTPLSVTHLPYKQRTDFALLMKPRTSGPLAWRATFHGVSTSLSLLPKSHQADQGPSQTHLTIHRGGNKACKILGK